MSDDERLLRAITNGFTEEALRLIACEDGVDVNVKNRRGQTALMLAASQRNEPVARALLDRPDLRVLAHSKKKMTPSDYFEMHGLTVLAQQIAQREKQATAERALSLADGRDPMWRGTCAECHEPIRLRRSIDYIFAEVASGTQPNLYIQECTTRFRNALDDPLHHRVANKPSLRKELSESMAIIKAVEAVLARTQRSADCDGRTVFVDCCCGAGLTSVLLSSAFPNARVLGLDLLSPRILSHLRSQNASIHQADLFSADSMLCALAAEDGVSLILIGMHLCGFLSTKLIELFSTLGSACAAVILSPCCLPSNAKAGQTSFGNLCRRAAAVGIGQHDYWCLELVQRLRLEAGVSVDLKQDDNVLSPRRGIITAYRSMMP
jgi:hypothetical protein